MIIWGGRGAIDWELNTGSYYDPSSNTWTPMTEGKSPYGRNSQSAIWTGTKLVVWGGYAFMAHSNTHNCITRRCLHKP